MNLPLLALLPHLLMASPGDTAAAAYRDSISPPPLPHAGAILPPADSTSAVTDSERHFIDYRTIVDIAAARPGLVVRDFGSPGYIPDLLMGGVGGRGIAWLVDGIRMNEPLTGLFDPNLIPPEEAGKVEVAAGPMSFLYGLNAAGGAINVVTRTTSGAHPRSRLRYSESANGYALVDGSVSEDIVRGLVVTAGVQHATFGPRFQNSGYDAWSGRLNARWTISPAFEAYLTESYAHTQLELNGGVNTLTTDPSLLFDEQQANVVDSIVYEKRSREDIRLGASFRIPGDAGGVTTVTGWYSSDLREYRDEKNLLYLNGIRFAADGRSDWSGLTIGHARTIGPLSLDASAEFRSERVIMTPATAAYTSAPYDLRARGILTPVPSIRLTGGIRYDRVAHADGTGWGIEAAFAPLPPIVLFGGLSRSYRFPSIEERYGIDTLLPSRIGDATVERHAVTEAGIRLSPAEGVRAEAAAFQRTISDGIVLVSRSSGSARAEIRQWPADIARRGVRGLLACRRGWLEADVTAEFLERADDGLSDREESSFPKWSGDAGIYYRDTLFGAHLDLKTGFRTRMYSAFTARPLDSRSLFFLPVSVEGVHGYPAGDAAIVDFDLIARIGDAHIHFIWENLGGREYLLEAVYPMPGRQIRLGVTWDFLN